ncbi:hypothetical protein ECANGB1_1000 [Enterospora canceri]|uniref:Uncharacterized protein n=1 Tax=Enterospora canceri TaxID=1081671 RepID=A0A1Y1S739_9MICR|nr:hypothetical protein ECANGB1_1000 [Enterospora canceri]
MFLNTTIIYHLLEVMADTLKDVHGKDKATTEKDAAAYDGTKFLVLKKATFEKGATDLVAQASEKEGEGDCSKIDLSSSKDVGDGFLKTDDIIAYFEKADKLGEYLKKTAKDDKAHKEATEYAKDKKFTDNVPTYVAKVVQDALAEVKDSCADPKKELTEKLKKGINEQNAYILTAKIHAKVNKDTFFFYVSYKTDGKEYKSEIIEAEKTSDGFKFKKGISAGSGSGMGTGAKVAIAIVVVVIVLALVGLGIYFYLASKKKEQAEDENIGMGNEP